MKARLQPRIRGLVREGVTLEAIKKLYKDDSNVMKTLSSSKPKIRVYLEDYETIQLIESAISLEYLTKATETLSIKKGELKTRAERMKNLASQLDNIKSKLV
ncbi:MAG: hypothetical protein QMD14_04055 [Candidatus Aenigmarchaeota archaeon]|nr:hypothetical protein [Candidatus Aenigmarchaeota archaeon]